MGYSVDIVAPAVKMFGFLGVILGCLLAASLYLKRRRGSFSGSGRTKNLMRIVQRCPVGVKKSIIAIEIPGAVLLVGVGADRMSLLARLEGDDADLSGLGQPDGFGTAPPFAAQLKRTIAAFRGDGNTGVEKRGRAE
jgi:flagellar biogenesis protein FliO